MTDFAECPFDECEWSTANPLHKAEADVVKGGWDRLALHLVAEHGAHVERDAEVWEDGSWRVALFPRRLDWENH